MSERSRLIAQIKSSADFIIEVKLHQDKLSDQHFVTAAVYIPKILKLQNEPFKLECEFFDAPTSEALEIVSNISSLMFRSGGKTDSWVNLLTNFTRDGEESLRAAECQLNNAELRFYSLLEQRIQNHLTGLLPQPYVNPLPSTD